MPKKEPLGIDGVRRRLMRAGAYTVPAVLSFVFVRNAGAQQSPSCNPYTMGMAMGNSEMAMGNSEMAMGNAMGSSGMD